MAGEVRFELTMGLHPRQFSRLVHSTALPLTRFCGGSVDWRGFIEYLWLRPEFFEAILLSFKNLFNLPYVYSH